MGQEPGSEAEIKEFAQGFGAKWSMFSKVETNGPNSHPVYQYLRLNSPLFDKQNQLAKEIPCNFTKFLVNENGHVVGYWDPNHDIIDIVSEITKCLQ